MCPKAPQNIRPPVTIHPSRAHKTKTCTRLTDALTDSHSLHHVACPDPGSDSRSPLSLPAHPPGEAMTWGSQGSLRHGEGLIPSPALRRAGICGKRCGRSPSHLLLWMVRRGYRVFCRLRIRGDPALSTSMGTIISKAPAASCLCRTRVILSGFQTR